MCFRGLGFIQLNVRFQRVSLAAAASSSERSTEYFNSYRASGVKGYNLKAEIA